MSNEVVQTQIDAPDAASAPSGASALPPLTGPITRIRPSSGWQAVDFVEIWRYRELLLNMAQRDIKIRYKQTILGASWAVLQPLMTMLVFDILFGMLMGPGGRKPTIEGVPYSVSTFCAVLAWQLFAGAITQASGCLVHNQGLITKIYFPRLIVPFASILVPVADFAVGFAVLLLLMLWHGVIPGINVVFLPLYILLVILCATSVGVWLAALNALYRDFRYITPFVVQAGMFITPVVYTYQSIEGRLTEWQRFLYCLNPLVTVVEGFRWALLGKGHLPGLMMLPGVIAVLLIGVTGLYYFRRMERTIADVV